MAPPAKQSTYLELLLRHVKLHRCERRSERRLWCLTTQKQLRWEGSWGNILVSTGAILGVCSSIRTCRPTIRHTGAATVLLGSAGRAEPLSQARKEGH